MTKLEALKYGWGRLVIKRDYKPEPYVEKFTRCDKCQRLGECKIANKLVEVTLTLDTRRHYIPNIGVVCPERGNKIKATKEEENC